MIKKQYLLMLIFAFIWGCSETDSELIEEEAPPIIETQESWLTAPPIPEGFNDDVPEYLQEYPVNYGIEINISNMHCAIYINDVSVYNSAYISIEPPNSMATGHHIAFSLENGLNDLKIRVIDDEVDPDKQQYCEATVTYDRRTQPIRTVNHLLIKPNEDGVFSAESSKSILNHDPILEGKITQLSLKETLHLDKTEAKDQLFTRPFIAAGLPQFMWTKATPFEDTPLNRKRLIAAYEDYRDAIDHRDIERLYELRRLPLEERKFFMGGGDTFIDFAMNIDIRRLVNDQKCWATEIDYDDYHLETYNGGRLIRLIKARDITPMHTTCIQNEGDDPIGYFYRGYFSLIDGKLIISH